MSRATFRNLEVATVLRRVAERAASAPARSRILSIAPEPDSERLERRRSRLREIRGLVLAPDPDGPRLPEMDLSSLEELDGPFSRLERGGVLEGEELLAVASVIRPALSFCRGVMADAEAMPALAAMLEGHGLAGGSRLAELERLDLEMDAALEPDGAIKDSASPELRRLRRSVKDLRSRLSARAAELVQHFADHLQDDFYTLREDRYVLPVRSDSRAGVPGIIHGSSNSGATLFVEPEPLIHDCNDLKVVRGEVQACEREVLAGLSAAAARQVAALRRVQELLVEIDVLVAIARFGIDVDGVLPDLDDAPGLDLRAARHPLLALSGHRVVANDVRIEEGTAWVVSGPNAGGKTVLLKTVGLAVLMTWMGLPVAVAERSRVGRFAGVWAEIGDAQSLESNLSTFSAQVTNLSEMLGRVGPGSLVLVDELATGTNPDEGAALAEALIREMIEAGVTVMVATHFEALKRLSISAGGFVAAGMGLDMDTLEPTFELDVGMPGSSGGLVVAERYGLPHRVIRRARRILGGGSGSDEEGRMQALERLKAELARKLEKAEALETDLRSRSLDLEREQRELAEQRRRSMQAEQRFLTNELRVLRSELRHAHKVLRRRPLDAERVRGQERVARRLGRALSPQGPIARASRPRDDSRPLGDEPLGVGERVVVPSMGLEGVVAELMGDRVRVDRGGVAWTVKRDRIRRPAGGSASQGGTKMDDDSKPTSPPDEGDEEWQSTYNTVDLRGRGLDEAKIDLDTFLDDAREMGMEQVFVIHGHGTGVLKNGLRRYLRHLSKVESFRPGRRDEGGDGVTVCRLRGP
jgi:DNA mismatch repair protein MutS2